MKSFLFDWQQVIDYPPCKPPLWLCGGHMQTLAPYLFQKSTWSTSKDWQQKFIPVSGDEELLAFASKGKSTRVFLLFHGLSGNSDSIYMQRLGIRLRAQDHSVVLVNHRQAHPLSPPSRQIYHSGRSDDVSAVVAWARAEFPNQMVYAIGVSMSANILLLNAAGVNSTHQPDISIAVNAPICLADAAAKMDKGFSQIYSWHFTQELKKTFAVAHSTRRIREFDDQVTAPKIGLNTGAEYYAKYSAKNYLSGIQIPTLVITAANDPFVDPKFYRDSKWPASVHLRIETQGGHLGYWHRDSSGKIRNWLDDFILAGIR